MHGLPPAFAAIITFPVISTQRKRQSASLDVTPLSDLPIGVWMGSSRCRERSAIFSRRRAAEPTS